MKRIPGPIFLATFLILAMGQRSVRADSVIAPFIDSQTNAIIHVDFSNLDMDQLAAWQSKAISTITDPDAKAKAQQQADQSFATSKKWVSEFRNAGGKDLYVVISLAGLMQQTAVGIVVPLNGADPVALAKVFEIPNMPKPDPADPNAAARARMMPGTAVIGNTLVFSTGAGLDKFKAPSSEARQDLLDGLAATGASPFQISVTPSTLKNNPFFKMIAAQMTQQGPGAPQQQSAAPMSDPQWDSVTWVSLSMNVPPKESASCTMQCKDADSASAMADLINKKIQEAKDDPAKHGQMSADDFNKLMTAVKPNVSGSQVVMSLDQDTIDNVLGPMMAKMSQHQAAAAGPVQAQPGGNAPPPADNSGNGM